LVTWLQGFFDFSLLAGQQIHPKLLGHDHKIAPRVPVAFCELIDQLLDAENGFRQQNVGLALSYFDLLVECILQGLL